MMDLNQTTKLYEAVLRQLLPVGGYDTAPNTVIAVDVKAHSRQLAQADLHAKRILTLINDVPAELVNEYEIEFGLPLACSINSTKTMNERIQIIKWAKSSQRGFDYYHRLLSFFDIQLHEMIKRKPMQCIASCTSAINTEQLRYKIKLILSNPSNTDMTCIINSYFPHFLQIDVVEV